MELNILVPNAAVLEMATHGTRIFYVRDYNLHQSTIDMARTHHDTKSVWGSCNMMHRSVELKHHS